MGRVLSTGRSWAYGARARANKAALALALSLSPAFAEPVTLAALGDSLTQGFGLPADQGFVPQLEAWLRGRGHEVVVINAGVSGDTTAGGLSRVGWTLTPDVDGMIVALGANDALRGLPPEVARANLDGILSAGAAANVGLMLIGIEAPPNYGPDYKTAFDAMYPDLAGRHGAALVPSFIGAITDLPDRAAAMATYVQPDGLHPNAAGVALIVERIGPAIETWLADLGTS